MAPEALAAPATDVAVCPACGDESLADARFCMHCGVRMTSDEGERRTVTVMFVNLRGFLDLSEAITPEELSRVADASTGRLIEIVTSYGGTLDKIIGENGLKVMALFGAPVAHGDDPERAVRCALAMMEDVGDRPETYMSLSLSIGIHTGEAIYAPVGPGGEHTVLGDTVNTAARLMAAAGGGEILVGEATHRAASSTITMQDVPPLVVKNKVEPVPAWRVERVVEAPAATTRRTPFIGREAELAALAELWAEVADEDRARSVAVVGAAGIGKGRLVRSFARRTDGARLCVGYCLSYGDGITYWPIIEIIKDLAGIVVGDSPDEISLKLGSLLEDLGTDDLDALRTMAVAVANIVASPTTPRGTYSAERISQQELHWGLRRLLQLYSRREPLIILIEDLHWSEPTLREFFTFLAASADPASFLVVGTGRPELADIAPDLLVDSPTHRTLRVGALTTSESRAMLSALVDADVGSAADAALERAAGNPLFLEELADMVSGPGGELDFSTASIPDTVQAMIEARLDRLSTRERRMAGRAAVVGQAFWLGTLKALAPSEDVESALEGLIKNEIISRSPASSIGGETEYVFRNAMLREIAYERIPKTERTGLHETCGRWISALPGSKDEHIEFIAYHFEQAVRASIDVNGPPDLRPTLAAATALQAAGRKAQRHDGTTEASRFYERALDLVGEEYPEASIELRFFHTETTGLMGKLRDATEDWLAIANAALHTGRPDLRSRALIAAANILGQTAGKPKEATELLAEARALAERIDDHENRVRLTVLSGSLRANHLGEPDGIEEMRRALDLAEELPDRNQLAEALLQLGTTMLNRGRFDEAEPLLQRAAEVSSELGSIRWGSLATSFLGSIKTVKGPHDEAEALLRQALTWCERRPEFMVETQARFRLSKIALARGDATAAMAIADEAAAIAAPAGGIFQVLAQFHVAQAHALAGDIEGAAAAADAAAAVEIDVPAIRAFKQLASAYAAFATGEHARMRSDFEGAIDLLGGAASLDGAEALLQYGDALMRAGDVERAREHLTAARETFDGMEARAMVEIIDGILATG